MCASVSVGVSIREFARLDGCAESLVRRGLTQGRLTKSADGKLDPTLAGSEWRKANRGESAHSKIVRTKVSAPTEAEIPVVLSDLDAFVAQLMSGKIGSYAEAERIKENALALKHVLTARKEAGSLIEIEAAESVVFDASRSARDAWLNWPIKIGPLLAADLGLEADKVTEVLTSYVHQHVAEIGAPAADFTSRQA